MTTIARGREKRSDYDSKGEVEEEEVTMIARGRSREKR